MDSTPPVIALNPSASYCTPQKVSDVTATVTDYSPVTTNINLNGQHSSQNAASPSGPTAQLTQSLPIQLALVPGSNLISVTSTDAAGNVASPATITITSLPQAPQITLSQSDNVYASKKSFTFTVSISSPSGLTNTVLQNGTQISEYTGKLQVSATLVELNNTFEIDTVNCAGLKSVAKLNSIFLDSVPPTITLEVSGPVLTNNPTFPFSGTVTSETTTNTVVTQNGTQILQSNAPAFSLQATLSEGINVFVVTSTDEAGNVSTATLGNIVLDTIPPVLSNLSPSNGATLTSLTFPVSLASNEKLSSASLNSQNLTVDATSGLTASGSYTAQTSGAQTFVFQATDLAGNTTTITESATIVLSVLNGNLISVFPSTDNINLVIQGAMGAAIPGITVNASAGLFSSASGVAGSDGSFSITMPIFTQAIVSATDPVSGMSSTVNLTYGNGGQTLLAGTVLDTNGNPLFGATISIAGSAVTPQTTDANGSFQFQQPVTGDQLLIIDGTTIAAAQPPAPSRAFAKISINVNIGLGQSNVLPRPIYLAPIPMDGSVPTVDPTVGATVTSPNAPGVSLVIPGNNVAQFPAGALTSPVALTTISANFATVVPPKFLQPQHLVSLEPSGTIFSQPVQLTIPNVDQLPAGVGVYIISENSETGAWEIDGAGTVSSDQTSIVTNPGMGITHFSTVFAAPTSPNVFPIGDQAMPSDDTFNGTVTSTVRMPSYLYRGGAITPTLIYNSGWANPSVVVSNMVDIPQSQTATVEYDATSSSYQTTKIGQTCSQLLTSCALGYCWGTNGASSFLGIDGSPNSSSECQTWIPDTYQQTEYQNSLVQISAGYQPQYVTAQFNTPIGNSPTFKFTGTPAQAVLSYQINLQNPNTQAYPSDGIYEYSSHYGIQLAETLITTVNTVTSTNSKASPTGPNTVPTKYDSTLLQTFSQDVIGDYHIDNETSSPFGRGWKFGGVQKIVGSNLDRVMVEEGDGTFSDYVLYSSVSTLFDASNTDVDLTQGVDFSNWPNAYVSGDNTIYQVNLLTGSGATALAGLPSITGLYYDSTALCLTRGPVKCTDFRYTVTGYQSQFSENTSQLLVTPNEIFGTSPGTSLLFGITGALGSGTPSYSNVAGQLQAASASAEGLSTCKGVDACAGVYGPVTSTTPPVVPSDAGQVSCPGSFDRSEARI